MITFLQGKLVDSIANRVSVDVHGVGYEVFMPLMSIESIGRPGDEVRILTHFHVREQEQTLYGFASADERDLFRLLLNRVSGVGPKLAMAVLSGISVADFKSAVVAGDTATLSQIKGLGKKTAERIVLELKDKVGVAAAWEAAAEAGASTRGHANDAILALISLGYKQVEAQRAVKKALETLDAETSSDELVRAALRVLS
ncbi:MAG: Holliday junction branch migration protein RuvA [Verrucomicrobiales bacterium]